MYGYPGIPPDAFAVSGSEDGSILCWDVVSKKILQRIEGHHNVVLGVDTCTIEDKRLMVSCGLDRTVRVWEEVDDSNEDAQSKNQEESNESEMKDAQHPAGEKSGGDDENETKDTDMTDAIGVNNSTPHENGVHPSSNGDHNDGLPNGNVPNGDNSDTMME